MSWQLWLCALIVAIASLSAKSEDFCVYDLTYALKYHSQRDTEVMDAWDHAHFVATLQGIVNRDAPRLYIRFVKLGGRNIDDYWLGKMQMPGQWLAGRSVKELPDLTALVSQFRSSFKGVVLYDPKVPATSNLASTIAGVEDLVAIRYDPRPESLYSKLVTGGPKLPVIQRLLVSDGTSMFTGQGNIPDTDLPSTHSAKCDAYLWLKAKYIDTGKVDATHAGFYIDSFWQKRAGALRDKNQHTLTNHDFFVAKRGFFFDLLVWDDETPIDDPNQSMGLDFETLKKLLLSAYEHGGKDRMIHIGGFDPWAYKYTNHKGAGGRHGGVPTEWQYGKVFSAYNGFVDADAINCAAMANASFFMHFPLKDRYPQDWITHEELIRRGLLSADGQPRIEGREFIIFYVGDYDSAAWVYQKMPELWDNPARGRIPLMWCVSPVLERRAGPMLDYLRRTATPNDYFAAADNGAGYLKPGMLQEPRGISHLPDGLDAWERHSKPLYQRWDMSITGFIIYGGSPILNQRGLDCYAAFSPNGIVPQDSPLAVLHGDMPVLRNDADLPGDAEGAAQLIQRRLEERNLPFTWFRGILKSPEWYQDVYKKVKNRQPGTVLLDAPAFFELLRVYLKTHPGVFTEARGP